MQNFNYRQHLINFHHDLQYFVDQLYAYGMTIGMKGELSDMRTVFEDGDEIPGDLNYLKSLKSEVVAGFVEIIETVFKIQNSLANLNAITEEELTLPEESEEELEDEYEPEEGSVYSNAERFVYAELLEIYIVAWQLANRKEEVPRKVINVFEDHFYDNELELHSSDANVQQILEGLNEMLRVNRLINYYADEDEGMSSMGWTMG